MILFLFLFPPTLGAASLLCCPGNKEYSLMAQPPTWAPTQRSPSLLHRMFILFGTGRQGDTNLGVTHLPVTVKRVVVAGDVFWGERGAAREAVTLENWGGETPFHQFLGGSCQARLPLVPLCHTGDKTVKRSAFCPRREKWNWRNVFSSLCLILTGRELRLADSSHGSHKWFCRAQDAPSPRLYVLDMTASLKKRCLHYYAFMHKRNQPIEVVNLDV